MSFVDELLSSLKNETNKELILPDALTFPSLDLEKFDLEINLEEQAKANGEKDFPAADTKDLDHIQQRVIEFTIRTIRPFYASYTEAIAAYNARLATLDPLGFDAKIRGLAAKKKAEIKMIASQANGEIYLQENYLQEREKEYQQFKEKHGNPPDPTTSMPTWIKYVIIILLVVLEGTLNSFFLGDYMRGGLLEGLAYALAIPLLSIVFFGSIAGISLRKIIRSHFTKKVFHSLVILAASLASLAVTLILAALRIAAEASEEYQDIALGLWISLIQLQPSHPMNTSGILLVAIGFAFFIVAMFDIKSLDHPIPGFIHAYKTREKAHQDYIKKMEELNNRLAKSADSSQEITSAFDKLQLWQMEYQHIIINRRQLSNKFNTYVKYIETQVNNLLSKYRQINIQHRKTPPPAHFSIRWQYPEVIAEPPESEALIKDFQEKLEKVYKNIDKIQKEIEEEVRQLSSVVTPVRAALGKK